MLETYVDAATASLRSAGDFGLQARIAALNATKTDFQIPTVPPERVHPGSEPQLVRYPAVEVAAPDFDVSEISLEQLTMDMDVRVVMAVWYESARYEHLWRGCMRLVTCVWECLIQPDAFGAGVVVSEVQGRFRVANPERTPAAEQLLSATILVWSLDCSGERPTD